MGNAWVNEDVHTQCYMCNRMGYARVNEDDLVLAYLAVVMLTRQFHYAWNKNVTICLPFEDYLCVKWIKCVLKGHTKQEHNIHSYH